MICSLYERGYTIMASKGDRFFYDNLIAAADHSCQAATHLAKCLENYVQVNLSQMMEGLHAIEHSGDEIKHLMSSALAKAFITPIDREDLALLSQKIDDVTDKIEEVLQHIYMDDIRHLPADTVTFANLIVECTKLTKDILEELPNFKRSSKLHNLIISLNNKEEECDRLYLKARLHLRTSYSDPLMIISLRDVFELLERCADACEHVGDCVETVIMKNT